MGKKLRKAGFDSTIPRLNNSLKDPSDRIINLVQSAGCISGAVGRQGYHNSPKFGASTISLFPDHRLKKYVEIGRIIIPISDTKTNDALRSKACAR